MNNLGSLVLPAVIGLVAGVGHGMISHYLNLPLSLTEQMLPVASFKQIEDK